MDYVAREGDGKRHLNYLLLYPSFVVAALVKMWLSMVIREYLPFVNHLISCVFWIPIHQVNIDEDQSEGLE